MFYFQGGPFTCQVFDTKGVHISGFEGAIPLLPHELEVDTSAAGVVGDVHADVVHDKHSYHVRVEKVNNHKYKLHFTPKHNGKHRVSKNGKGFELQELFFKLLEFFLQVYVYFNGHDVHGSPFMMKVGTQRGRKSSNSPTAYTSNTKLYTSTSSNSPSPQNTYNLRHSLNQSPINDSNYVTTQYHSTNSPNLINTNSPSPILFESAKPSKYLSTFSTDVVDKGISRNSPVGVRMSPSRSPTTNKYFDNRPTSPGSPDNYYKKTQINETRTYKSSNSPNTFNKSERFEINQSPTFIETRESAISPSYSNKLSTMHLRDTQSPIEFGKLTSKIAPHQFTG